MRLGREQSMGVVEEREEEQRVADMTAPPGDGTAAPAAAPGAAPGTAPAPAAPPAGGRAAEGGLIRSR